MTQSIVIKVAGRDALCVSAGLRNGAITAPLLIDQQMNGEIFLAWLEQFLIPTLSARDIDRQAMRELNRKVL